MANITELFVVRKVYESFILGFCNCPCRIEISIRNKMGKLNRYKQGHWAKTRKGKKKGRYRLGKYWMLSGYYDHPNVNKEGKILEHIFVMSQYLGRPLKKGEIVHHKKPVTEEECDNDISNLYLTDRSNHNKIHHPKIDTSYRRCLKCGTYETYYDEEKDHFHWHGSDEKGWNCNNCYFKKLNSSEKRKAYKREWNKRKRSKN